MCQQTVDQRWLRVRPAQMNLQVKYAHGIRMRRKPPVQHSTRTAVMWPLLLPPCTLKVLARNRLSWPQQRCLLRDKRAFQVPALSSRALKQHLVSAILHDAAILHLTISTAQRSALELHINMHSKLPTDITRVCYQQNIFTFLSLKFKDDSL